MATKDILIFTLPVISGLLGSYLTYYFAMRSKRTEAILRFKEEKYTNLMLLLQGFTGRTATGDNKRAFFEEQYRSWLYASDDVVLAMKDMVNLVIRTQLDRGVKEQNREAIGKIILAMRRDMLGGTNLTADDFQYTDVVDS